ncbi:hypothetical protein [Burkholderia ubonensis]|uniref:hypothetical protein n=1 Tax=Burkholderia ubonensis TaxID=101571 RepID=UPI0012FCB765|nr:hypothetical protein [Burkholderia ubonensis]
MIELTNGSKRSGDTNCQCPCQCRNPSNLPQHSRARRHSKDPHVKDSVSPKLWRYSYARRTTTRAVSTIVFMATLRILQTRMPMTTAISAQNVLGETLAADFVKAKARRELDRAMADGERFLDHAANFAVSVTHVMDWTYYLRVQANTRWNGIGCDEFRKRVVAHHQGVSVFLDFANEFKHADRKPGATKILDHLYFDSVEEEHPGSATPILLDCSISSFTKLNFDSGKKTFLVPMIRSKQDAHFFKQVATDTLAWWDAFDPDQVGPDLPSVYVSA